MNAIDELAESFSRLPGIGKKTGKRLAYHILKTDRSFAQQFAQELLTLHDRIHSCKICGSHTENEICAVCANPNRERNLLCIVEQPQDVQIIEASHEFKGLFHVLGALIAPLEGIGPEKLPVDAILKRIEQEKIEEIIIATNPTIEGDTTALYLQRVLQPSGVRITRLASGIPVGGDLEYADKLTLARSFRGRSSF